MFQFDRLFNCYVLRWETKEDNRSLCIWRLIANMEPAEDKIPCSTMIIENSEGFKFCLTPPETLPAIKLVWDLRYRLDTPFQRLSNWKKPNNDRPRTIYAETFLQVTETDIHTTSVRMFVCTRRYLLNIVFATRLTFARANYSASGVSGCGHYFLTDIEKM